jgi:hypothetical protein
MGKEERAVIKSATKPHAKHRDWSPYYTNNNVQLESLNRSALTTNEKWNLVMENKLRKA